MIDLPSAGGKPYVICGGDSLAVQDQLRDVQQIQAAYYAFAAIRGDGSVVTWGEWWRQQRGTGSAEARAANPSFWCMNLLLKAGAEEVCRDFCSAIARGCAV